MTCGPSQADDDEEDEPARVPGVERAPQASHRLIQEGALVVDEACTHDEDPGAPKLHEEVKQGRVNRRARGKDRQLGILI